MTNFVAGQYSSNPQSFTETRRKQIESTFKNNKADILADIESIELSMLELTEKWGVSDRVMRRWMERCGIDSIERTYARRRAGLEKKPARPEPKVKVDPDKAQAHLLRGLW